MRGEKVQDQGTYRCYTRTIRGSRRSFMKLKLDAPVSEVHMSQEGNWISCSSDGIYPEPGLTWSTIPLSNMELQTRTRVHQTEAQQLSDGFRGSDLIHSCTVTTHQNKNSFKENS
ncbi:neural cell adhesion molecule L1 [Austrofundulus limnaeus]|uniref:Neural cell adhesion molecule L1 n=1 Tax=Austrofundulus limnaeus TaxID=52670 RepID=A0A2I4AKU0_AUSLI|nr:PREDICTED: neural cell adhesion molecule L1-like [Austrofundulus limnaeus]